MYCRRGELAIISCSNGNETANHIVANLEKICRERKPKLLDKDGKLRPHEKQELGFIEYVENFGINLFNVDVKRFKDSEILSRIPSSIRGMDVYVVQNTFASLEDNNSVNDNLEEMRGTVDAARRARAANVSVVWPYMNYSKQERQQGRESPTIKRALDEIESYGTEGIITMDLHAPAIRSFTAKMSIENLFASVIFIDYLKKMEFDGVLLAPDPNAGKHVQYYHLVTGLPMVIGYKERKSAEIHAVEDLQVLDVDKVTGRDVAIIDDQIATGETTLTAAKIVMAKGARRVYSLATHALMIDKAERMFREAAQNGLLEKLVVTNTIMHPKDFYLRNPYIDVLDSMAMFAKAIYEIHTDGSISGLYGPDLRKAIFGDTHEIQDN